MGFTELIGRSELSTNFLYLHAGIIEPKSGIGHHFHHNIEEMYVLLNGEAEFTVNGSTSKIKAPAITRLVNDFAGSTLLSALTRVAGMHLILAIPV